MKSKLTLVYETGVDETGTFPVVLTHKSYVYFEETKRYNKRTSSVYSAVNTGATFMVSVELLPPKRIKVVVFLLEKDATAAFIDSVFFDDSLTIDEKGRKLAGEFTGVWVGVVDLSSKLSECSTGKMVSLNNNPAILNGWSYRIRKDIGHYHSIIATGNIFYKD